MERIVLAFVKDETADKVRRMVEGSGYEVCAVYHSKAELLRSVSDSDDLLVIMSYRMRDGSADEVCDELYPNIPVMALVKAEQADFIENENVFSVVLPMNRAKLRKSLDMMAGSIARRRHKPQRTEEDKRVIELAKKRLMDEHNMTEMQAHRFIQKRSMDTGGKFVDTARVILEM